MCRCLRKCGFQVFALARFLFFMTLSAFFLCCVCLFLMLLRFFLLRCCCLIDNVFVFLCWAFLFSKFNFLLIFIFFGKDFEQCNRHYTSNLIGKHRWNYLKVALTYTKLLKSLFESFILVSKCKFLWDFLHQYQK